MVATMDELDVLGNRSVKLKTSVPLVISRDSLLCVDLME